MGIRRIAAIATAKIIQAGCKLVGKQGATLAGMIALKMDPAILKDLASQVKNGIIVVCGTNGKTTTNNLLCSALEGEGKKVICNHTGSNMLNGVAAAFVLGAKLSGKLDADYACIECDEASTVHIFPQIQPQYMVLTNLFRDQLDRYGEIDITMELLLSGIERVTKGLTLMINGDDALSTYLAMESGQKFITFGISEQVKKEADTTEIREGRFCKKCGSKLEYDFYHFSQMGSYHCDNCGFARPDIDYDVSDIDMENGLSFCINKKDQIKTNYRGFYNIYNILAAYAMMDELKVPTTGMNRMLAAYQPENGRNEVFQIGNTKVILNLAKNPAGFNQNLVAVMEDKEKKDIMIVINDNDQDGTDISWLWDVDYDCLESDLVNSITVSGKRCYDMRLRLKYVDIPSDLVADVGQALEKCLASSCGNLYVLVNYTALYSTHMMLKKMEKKR